MDGRSYCIKKSYCLLILLSSVCLDAQNDNISWLSFQLQKKIGKTELNFKPIFRFNEDISSYQNMSLDYAVKQQLKKGWSIQLTGRTWFIPNQKPRQFVWPEISYGFSKGTLRIDNRIRYHLALDINDREDPDFLRWSIRFMYTKGTIKPFLAFEPWFRLNSIEKIQRIRYVPGVNWKLSDHYSVSFIYWKQESVHIEPKESTNIWLVNLLVKL